MGAKDRTKQCTITLVRILLNTVNIFKKEKKFEQDGKSLANIGSDHQKDRDSEVLIPIERLSERNNRK